MLFSTLCPMSIKRWNWFRLHQHRTSHLNSFNQYNTRETIEEAIFMINTTILTSNNKNKVATPTIVQLIMYLRNGHRWCHYGKPMVSIQAKIKWPNGRVSWKKIWTKTGKPTKHTQALPSSPSAAFNYEDMDGSDSNASCKQSGLY